MLTSEATQAAVDAVAKALHHHEFRTDLPLRGYNHCECLSTAAEVVAALQADRSLLLGLLGIDKQYDAVVQLLHLVDGHLGLAVYRGEGNSDRWRKEASALITKIRGQIKALAGDPS